MKWELFSETNLVDEWKVHYIGLNQVRNKLIKKSSTAAQFDPETLRGVRDESAQFSIPSLERKTCTGVPLDQFSSTDRNIGGIKWNASQFWIL